MKRPSIGETFTNGIDDITDSGEGKIQVHDGYINVGPVTPDALGVKIKATLVEHDRAELHTEELRPPVDEIGETADSFWVETSVRVGKTFSAVIDEVTNEGHGLIYTRSGFINLGPVTPDAEGEYVHALKLPGDGARVKSAKVQPDNYIQKLENLFNYDFSLDFGNAGQELGKREHKAAGVIGEYTSISEVRSETTSPDEIQNGGHDSEGGSRTDTESGSVVEEHEPDKSTQTGLEELRKKAEEDSVKEIPTDTPTYTSSKQEYTRSSAIREYVKARADGVCEACGSPAPFDNPDGEPYLHAHHIHELSDGGSDTIDTVAAVCPNCHYRIHHGRDGDEYNQELLETIKAIENEE